MLRYVLLKKSILINALGGKSWIGGLYYRKNIAFELLQNEEISSHYKVVVFASKENESIFRCINGIKIVGASDNSKLQKIQKLFVLLFNRVCCEYPQPRLSKLLGAMPITWIPDFQHNYYHQFFKEEEIKNRDALYSSYSQASAPLILSSNACKADLDKFYPNSKENIYVVPFVSYIENEIKALSSEREKEILAGRNLSSCKYAVVMNQFWQHKNHIVVFEAIKKLMANHPDSDIRFVFTGMMDDYRNPEYIDRLKSIAEEPEVAANISILGFIDRDEQLAIMKNAAFVIQPSLFEGWGTVVEDAKVLDKTVLLSDIPVHREQMNDKCHLFVPDNSDELAELIYSESKKEHLDDIQKGISDMYVRAKEYSGGFEKLLTDMEKK